MALFILMFGYPLTLIVGLPAYLLLTMRQFLLLTEIGGEANGATLRRGLMHQLTDC
jgi:hypothetical protein